MIEHVLNNFELILNCWQDFVLTNSKLLLWLDSEKDNQKAALVDALCRKVRVFLYPYIVTPRTKVPPGKHKENGREL